MKTTFWKKKCYFCYLLCFRKISHVLEFDPCFPFLYLVIMAIIAHGCFPNQNDVLKCFSHGESALSVWFILAPVRYSAATCLLPLSTTSVFKNHHYSTDATDPIRENSFADTTCYNTVSQHRTVTPIMNCAPLCCSSTLCALCVSVKLQ